MTKMAKMGVNKRAQKELDNIQDLLIMLQSYNSTQPKREATIWLVNNKGNPKMRIKF